MFEHKKVITMSPSVSVLKKILHIMVGCLAFMGKWYGAAMNWSTWQTTYWIHRLPLTFVNLCWWIAEHSALALDR